ncbi:MAG: hypothetical protein KJ771_03325 [Nanoarchaeota archaeon]|nr:hypothetical protein [Nanoarchaeota archaeon]
MSKYPQIEITKDDLRQIVYFIIMLFRSENIHLQGQSAKRDYIGGYIERWANKLPETLIFNELFKAKGYKVMPDYFLYPDAKDKNAPDILGIKKENGTIIPFTKYKNGTWVTVDNMPRIEAKAIRKDQYLLTVREPQMIDDYYVFVETDMELDYLTTLFEEEVFADKYINELEVNDIFIDEDIKGEIMPHNKIKKAEKIGTMRLIGIYTKEEFKSKTIYCEKGLRPYYFLSAENSEAKSTWSVIEELKVNNKIADCKFGKGIATYIPFSIEGAEDCKIQIIKKYKSTLYIKSPKPLNIGGVEVEKGVVKIIFREFERGTKWDENIAQKYVAENYWTDSTDQLIELFDRIAST